jgi:hypothetical protein
VVDGRVTDNPLKPAESTLRTAETAFVPERLQAGLLEDVLSVGGTEPVGQGGYETLPMSQHHLQHDRRRRALGRNVGSWLPSLRRSGTAGA